MALCNTSVNRSFRQLGFGSIGGNAYVVQDKEYFRLGWSTVSFFRASERVGTTCSREVAVSVRTPPQAPRWAGRAVLEDRKEEAGRERRETERANTMMNGSRID